jgi:hypothetical protein
LSDDRREKLTYDEKKQWASDVLGDLRLAIERKRRVHKKFLAHGAAKTAAALALEIEGMEAELQCGQELFDMTFNLPGG